ncbi:MAG: efflux RND transporter periplasmic adaptor subunit, partial [Endozoicomonas sp.]
SQNPLFYQRWLSLLCQDLAGCFSALVVNCNDENWTPAAVWPETGADTTALTELVDEVIHQKTRLVMPLSPVPGQSQQAYGLGLPVEHSFEKKGEVISVVAVSVRAENANVLKTVMDVLQKSVVWLRVAGLEKQQCQMQGSYNRLSEAFDLLAKVLAGHDFDASAMALLSALGISQNSELVALGFLEQNRVKICHLSQSSRFGEKMNVVRRLEAAMTEATDQHRRILCPDVSPGEGQDSDYHQPVILAHKALVEGAGQSVSGVGYSVLTLPLLVDGESVGALILQREGLSPFTEEDAQYCESVVSLSVPYLLKSRSASQSLFRLALTRFRRQLEKLFGKGYPGRKLVAVLSVTLVALLGSLTGEYRLSANATLGTELQRSIVAPVDGFVVKAPVRAGDRVKAGDEMVHLDDRELQLERLRWKSQQVQLRRELQDALGANERARVNIITAQIDQASVQLELVESQIKRTVQRAPFDGLVLSGDLSQKLGGTVRRGESLFEISPLDAWRIQLEVDESRIGDVRLGQEGFLYLSALPETPQTFIISRVTPLTVSRDGGTFYRVEASLQASGGKLPALQPGMAGVGKIRIDERRLMSIWSRDMLAWLRMQWWIFWG